MKSVLLFLLALTILTPCYATMIDLNDFYADPSVIVSADGSFATMYEDPFFSYVLLSNDPGLGDPNVITAGLGTWLFFDYVFTEGIGSNNDEFGAFVLDSTGFSAGSAYEFFTLSSGSSTVSFDLSGLVAEPFLGLQFQLSALPGDLGVNSVVEVSNVRLEHIAPVPEPATLAMVGFGLLGVALAARKRCETSR